MRDRDWVYYVLGLFVGVLIGIFMELGASSYIQNKQAHAIDELARDAVKCGQRGVAYARFSPDGGVVACRDGRSWTVKLK